MTSTTLRRRTAVTAASAAIVLTLAACSAESNAQESGTSDADDFSVAYVMSDNLGDRGFNDSAKDGFDRAAEEGVATKLLEASPDDPQLWRQNLESTSASGEYDLIFTGPGMHDNLAAVAPQHSDQKYVFFDDELDEPNVLSIKYSQNEGSYLAGVLAGAATSDTEQFPLSDGNDHVAVIAGQDLPVIQDFIVGFQQGVASVDPGIKVTVTFVDSFNDAQKAYDLASAAINDGADVVYNVAGPAGLGILKAAADGDKYAIGVDSDQNALHPEHVLASMLKHIGNSVYDAIEQVQAGEAEFGTLVTVGLANEGVGLVFNDDLVPASVQEQVAAAKQEVIDGVVTVDSAFQ
ncbi:BMP family lipoprotein [Georgenia sp.]